MTRLALLLMALLLCVPAASAHTAPSVQAVLQGPTLIANSTTAHYKLIVGGGPASSGGGNYSYTATVSARNTTGVSISPVSGSSALGVFYVNITAGGSAEVLTAKFNITSGTGSDRVNVTREFLITVVHPVVITVPVSNEGNVGVQGANITLYINGHYIGTKEVNLSAGATENVTFVWLAYSYPQGKSTATVIVNSTGSLVFSNGQTETSFTIYIPGNGNRLVEDYIIVGIIFAAALFVLLALRRAKPRK